MSTNHTVDEIAAALRSHHGIILSAAKALNMTRQGVEQRVKKSPVLLAVLEESRESMTDTAEAALYASIIKRDPWAVQFYLKTQGKKRGYVDRVEHEHSGVGEGGALVIRYVNDWRSQESEH